MPSSKVSLGGLSGAFDDVYRAYKIEFAMHKKPIETTHEALNVLHDAYEDVVRSILGELGWPRTQEALAHLAGLAIRAMVDLE